ncbi:MAG: 4-hydroxythreonine-4-phosphate dehydrogenase PdxA [Candidatus Omnitrophota bacterium]
MKRIRIAITMGDPAGIGPEIISKSLKSLKHLKSAHFIVFGSRELFRLRGLKESKSISLVDVGRLWRSFTPGMLSKEAGHFSFKSLKEAVLLLKRGGADCLVTGPISKEAVRLAGFCWPGHTEYLADFFGSKEVEMVFVAQKLKTVLVTRHLALNEAIRCVKKKRIVLCGKLVYKLLTDAFKISDPKIAICGLNPHAGESGLFGQEEKKEIEPALKSLNRVFGHHFFGPFAADTLFCRASQGEFDLVMAMYHDQGLIPFKMIAFETGVNLTAGLPFIRTSPAHGTAFDIAGKNKAKHCSMRQAILLAYELSKKNVK